MKYQAEFRKQYFAKIKDDGYELNGQMFAQMEKDLYIEWLETKLQNTSSNVIAYPTRRFCRVP